MDPEDVDGDSTASIIASLEASLAASAMTPVQEGAQQFLEYEAFLNSLAPPEKHQEPEALAAEQVDQQTICRHIALHYPS
jgi:hypothetical protein